MIRKSFTDKVRESSHSYNIESIDSPTNSKPIPSSIKNEKFGYFLLFPRLSLLLYQRNPNIKLKFFFSLRLYGNLDFLEPNPKHPHLPNSNINFLHLLITSVFKCQSHRAFLSFIIEILEFGFGL